MGVKSLVFAAALALAPLPAAAFSFSPSNNIADGGSYVVQAGPYFFDVTSTPADIGSGPGSFSFEFTSTKNQQTNAFSTVLQISKKLSFSGLVIAWAGGDSVAIAEGVTGAFVLGTIIAGGASDILTMSWTDVKGRDANVDIAVAAIPVPPALLLLASGLAGLGAVSRFRKRGRQEAMSAAG